MIRVDEPLLGLTAVIPCVGDDVNAFLDRAFQIQQLPAKGRSAQQWVYQHKIAFMSIDRSTWLIVLPRTNIDDVEVATPCRFQYPLLINRPRIVLQLHAELCPI